MERLIILLLQVLMTIGQLCFYDQVKALLLGTDYFSDNLVTHFTSSLCAGAIATTMTQPLDVCKTRAMNAKPGEFKGALDLIRFTGRNGPMAFYKVRLTRLTSLNNHPFIFIGIHTGICEVGPTNDIDICLIRAAQNEFWYNPKVTFLNQN